jgi:hypothetical protein
MPALRDYLVGTGLIQKDGDEFVLPPGEDLPLPPAIARDFPDLADKDAEEAVAGAEKRQEAAEAKQRKQAEREGRKQAEIQMGKRYGDFNESIVKAVEAALADGQTVYAPTMTRLYQLTPGELVLTPNRGYVDRVHPYTGEKTRIPIDQLKAIANQVADYADGPFQDPLEVVDDAPEMVDEDLEAGGGAIADEPMPEGEAMEGADDGAMPEDEAIATPASLKALVASLDLRRGDGTKIPDALNKKLKSRLNQVISTAVKMDAVPEREFAEKINKKIDSVYRLFEKEVAGEIWQNNDGAYQRPFNKVFGAIIDWAKGVRMQESDQNHTDMLDAQLAEATRLAREERLGLHLSGPDRALYRFNAEIKRDQALRRIDEEVAQRNQLNKTGAPMTIDNFLRKALGNPGREFGSGSWRDTGIPAMGRKVDAKSPQPKGGKKVQMDESASAHAGKGIGGKQPKAHRPYSSGGMPPTDVFGITITQLTRNLAKACYMDKDAWGSPETVSFLTDSARAIAGMTDTPTDPMVNFVRFLQYCTRFAQELPFMNDYQAAGTVKAMNADLTKALDEFVEKMPEELKGKPLRPAGSPGVVGIDVQFPQQYVIYS